MRNLNPFTARQVKLLKAIHTRDQEIKDPDKGYISFESLSFSLESTKQFGRIPKIRFSPSAQSMKSEIMGCADLTQSVSKDRKSSLASLRQNISYTAQSKPKNDTQRLADVFDKEWDNIMLKAKKAMFTIAFLNHLFAGNEQIAEPVRLLQGAVMEEYAGQLKAGCNELSALTTEDDQDYGHELMRANQE
ncbi:MAG: hypothetical protein U5L00_07705 [Desulfovermiculus sp.]|nr:hypothetical protein [Desulfovermiculus sp.]